MIVSVRKSKARLSELLSKASSGEDVVITVRGRPTVRLVPIHPDPKGHAMGEWAKIRREALKRQLPTGGTDSGKAILDALREDRF